MDDKISFTFYRAIVYLFSFIKQIMSSAISAFFAFEPEDISKMIGLEPEEKPTLGSGDEKGATKRQLGKTTGLFSKLPTIGGIEESGIVSRFTKIFGLSNAPILKHFLGIILVFGLGELLMACVTGSSSSNPVYLLYISKCLFIWTCILMLIIFINLIGMIFKNLTSPKKQIQ